MIRAIARLIRLPNLLIIGGTQVLMRYCILVPFLGLNSFQPQLSTFHFSMLVLATIAIAAAGYIINDYFDTRTDRINKPEKVVIDTGISRRTAILLHTILSIIGVLMGVYLSFYIKVPGLSLIFLLASGMLWFYSTSYKRQFLLGNLMVSLLTATVPILVVLFEIPLLNREYGDLMIRNNTSFSYIFIWVSGFGFFAFITTLIREIIKDAEDFEGDSAFGMNTLPIVIGTKATKAVVASLSVLFIVILLWVLYRFILFSGRTPDYLSASYFLLLLTFPTLILTYKIIFAERKRDYTIASMISKFIMLSGIMYSLLVRFIVMNQKF